MEEDCWVIDVRRITPESLGDISDIIGENETVLWRTYLGARGTDAKKKRSLKVGHETLHEFIYILQKQKKIC
jgi:hypothetical protein